jgi:hypothetical protein
MNFRISKISTSKELPGLVKALNEHTRDGHIREAVRLTPTTWLLFIEVSTRDDADLIRGW